MNVENAVAAENDARGIRERGGGGKTVASSTLSSPLRRFPLERVSFGCISSREGEREKDAIRAAS